MATKTSSDEKHVAVLAFPFATHPGLLLGLARRLAKAAPDVKFSFFSTAKSNASLFFSDGCEENNIRAFDIPDGVPEGYVFAGKPQEDIDLFLEVAEENFKKCLIDAEKVIGISFSCIIADAFLRFSAEISSDLGVSWIPVWTSAAGSLSVHVYTDLIRETVGLIKDMNGREDEILTFIPGFSELRLGDLPAGIVFGRLESPFSVMLHKMGQTLHRADALPMNSFEELEPPVVKDLKSKFKNVLNVGPFNLTSPPPTANLPDTYGCIPWLDKHGKRTVAYIAFGTVATPPPHELKALAEALEATETPFIWSLKNNMKSHLPEGFLERTSGNVGKIVDWAPQMEILRHESVGVFLNHCGWNSVLESISAGVPIIARPFFGDHQINTWMVENVWKIGVRIKDGCFTKDSTIRVLDLVLKQEEMGKKLKDQVVRYEKLALQAVGSNGSSTMNFESLVQIVINGSS